MKTSEQNLAVVLTYGFVGACLFAYFMPDVNWLHTLAISIGWLNVGLGAFGVAVILVNYKGLLEAAKKIKPTSTKKKIAWSLLLCIIFPGSAILIEAYFLAAGLAVVQAFMQYFTWRYRKVINEG